LLSEVDVMAMFLTGLLLKIGLIAGIAVTASIGRA
jgi:hypothetical protein